MLPFISYAKDVGVFWQVKDKNGKYSFCKTCHNKKRKGRNQLSTLPRRFQRWEFLARKKKMAFSIGFKDVEEMPFVCYYTGIPLTTDANQYNTVSLDRMDSTKGYVKGNVALCCEIVNRMKQELSCDDFVSYCKRVVDTCTQRKLSI
jgi:hypothetical protein